MLFPFLAVTSELMITPGCVFSMDYFLYNKRAGHEE